MAITFSPVSPVSFGSVYAGASTAQTVTVSNSDTVNTATVVAPTQTGFSMSAGSLTVPVATTSGGTVTNGSLAVTITFAPPTSQSAATQSYTGSLSCTSAGSTALCTLNGTGLTGVTVRPANVDFGSVAQGSTVSQAVSVTTTGASSVTLSAPSPFTLSPSTVPGNSTNVAVTISFEPGGTLTYSGSVTDANGVTACGLSGAGVALSPEQSGGDPEQWETESDATDASAGDKYYQVAVPNFALDGDTSNPGNSFVRLGSFPAIANWTSSSGPTGDTTTSPTGFQNSLNLASLIGNPALIQDAEGSGPSTDTVPGGFSDGSGLPSPYDGAGDADYLLGFADDTRLRGTPDDGTMNVNNMAPQTILAGQTVPNTPANRQAETLSLLTKGGWWDHSDGNRVTTTSGDKIEVIQGNYKLIVLGRQPLPSSPRSGKSDSNYANLVDNAFITDVSGGHFQEQYPSPTPCIKTIEYSLDSTTNEWTLYQDNTLGNLITKLKGRTVDMFQGTSRETYVGEDPTLKGNDSSWTPDTSCDPAITSKTWAQRIMTYVGSAQKPVPEIFTLTFADAIQDIKFVTADVLSSTSATTVMNVTTAGVVGNVYVAPLTMELATGYKYSFQPSFLGIIPSDTRIHGVGTVATVTTQKLAATEQTLAAEHTKLVGAFTKVAAAVTVLRNEAMELGQSRVELAQDSIHLSGIFTAGL